MATTTPTSEPIQSNPSVYLQNSDELKKVFTQFDTNGDGKISVSELGNVLKALGTSVASKDLQQVMEELDSDHDGFISLEEFAAFCRQSSEDGGASELKDAFDLYDQDHNGLISASELHQVLSRLGMNCSVEDCHRMIGSVDADGDGNVNFEEFKTMMTNSMANGSNKGSAIH
ncbi:probable calcium-binding protein CML27 [Humulus lupulus]|uniref:probable calcium-binding protein CML27 n=1 Tax=Humulus lupulus TaxID=3486 RepID=UPI002B417781|nr:probable calcium-binding protein CML27 [Humulus lupulus]